MLAVALVLLCLPQAPQDYATPRLVAESLSGEFRAHGDFDADGDVDLLHYSGSTLGWTGFAVFANDGTGNYTAGPVTAFQFPASYTSGTLQPFVGDFDGDGLLDFALARDGAGAAVSEGIEFFLGDGTGAFPTRLLVPMSTPRWIAVGNLDGDAAAEIAVDNIDANFDRRLGWVDFQGGVPVRLPTLLLVPAAAPTPTVFTVTDTDGDGDDDIVATATTAQPHDTVQFFPTVAGVPTVGTAFTAPAVMRNINHRIHAGDVDGDGDRDLVVLQMGPTDVGPNVQVYERTGSGWLQRPAQSVPTPNTGWIQPHSTALVDWDGDGRLDVAASAGARLDVLRSVGGLAFAEGFETLSTGARDGGGTFDVDGDGDVDFAGGNSILFGNGTFVPPTIEVLPFVPTRLRDLEGDGDVDLDSNGAGWFARNNATGAFTATQRAFPSASPDTWAAPIAYADFDGDGRPEHLVMRFHQPFPSPMVPFTPLGMWRIGDDGNDGFLPPVAATVAPDVIAGPTVVVAGDDPHWGTGDVDGDGDVDLLIDGGYRENDGTGQLTVFVAAWSGRGRAVADVDGDGVPDLVSTSFTNANTTVRVWRGTGSGFSNVFTTTVSGRADARFVDLDGDLDLDLAVAATDVTGLQPCENVGGTFFVRTALPFVQAVDLDHLGTADFDGDGTLDLAVPAQATGPLGASYATVSRLHGTGTALGFVRVADHLTYAGISGLVDVDADGDFDAIGTHLLRGSRSPANFGAVRQYGEGGPGTAGIRPVLGATGPVLSTSFADELRLVRGTAGAPGVLVFGLVETTLTLPSLPGLFVHVGDPVFVTLPPLGGTPLVGGGELAFPLPNLPFTGWTLVVQVFLVDAAAPSGWAATNGLAITFGL